MYEHFLICDCKLCLKRFTLPITPEKFQEIRMCLQTVSPVVFPRYLHNCFEQNSEQFQHNYGAAEVVGVYFKEVPAPLTEEDIQQAINLNNNRQIVVFAGNREEYSEFLKATGSSPDKAMYVDRVEKFIAAEGIDVILYGSWEERHQAKYFILHIAIREENRFFYITTENELVQVGNKKLLDAYKEDSI